MSAIRSAHRSADNPLSAHPGRRRMSAIAAARTESGCLASRPSRWSADAATNARSGRKAPLQESRREGRSPRDSRHSISSAKIGFTARSGRSRVNGAPTNTRREVRTQAVPTLHGVTLMLVVQIACSWRPCSGLAGKMSHDARRKNGGTLPKNAFRVAKLSYTPW
jgi:hypothetical protein